MSNFGYLLSISQYKSFAQLCIDAENAITRPPYRVCITECRVALEKCVKFIYTKEMNLTLLDYSNMSLWDMIDNCNFRKIVPIIVYNGIQDIRLDANNGLHNGVRYDKPTAMKALKALFSFVQWIDKRYNPNYTQRYFSETNINLEPLNKPNEPNETSSWTKFGYFAFGSAVTFLGLALYGAKNNNSKL